MHDHYATLYTGCFFVDVQLPPGEGLFCTLAKHLFTVQKHHGY
jgi:hypothetical protein